MGLIAQLAGGNGLPAHLQSDLCNRQAPCRAAHASWVVMVGLGKICSMQTGSQYVQQCMMARHQLWLMRQLPNQPAFKQHAATTCEHTCVMGILYGCVPGPNVVISRPHLQRVCVDSGEARVSICSQGSRACNLSLE